MLEKLLASLAAIIGLAATAATCVVFYYVWPEKDSTMPAWVQAVGSVFAIVAAIAIASKQSRDQRFEATRRELEAAVRTATFGKAVAQRSLAAVDHFTGQLSRWPADAPFRYDLHFLNAAERLLVIALERDLPSRQIEVLVAHHNELINMIGLVTEIQGIVYPRGHVRVQMFTEDWHKKLRISTMDAIEIEVAATVELDMFLLRRL